MIPIADDNSSLRGSAVVNWTLLALNILVFIFIQRFGFNEAATLALAAIPEEILSGHRLFTLITSQFTHAGFAHLIGNMLFLSIFGDNVECRIGRRRYILLYLISGTFGMLLQILLAAAVGGAALQMPLVGASAAISGVLAAYLVLFPGNKVVVLLFLFHTQCSLCLVCDWLLVLFASAWGSLWTHYHSEWWYCLLCTYWWFFKRIFWARSYRKKEAQKLAEWRKKRLSGTQDGFYWWVVDDD